MTEEQDLTILTALKDSYLLLGGIRNSKTKPSKEEMDECISKISDAIVALGEARRRAFV